MADYITHTEASELYAYAIAGAAILLAGVLAQRLATLRADHWYLRKEAQRDANKLRRQDQELRELRWQQSVRNGVYPTAEQHLGIPVPPYVDSIPAEAPKWTTDPCAAPDQYPMDAAGIAALADTTAEWDLSQLFTDQTEAVAS